MLIVLCVVTFGAQLAVPAPAWAAEIGTRASPLGGSGETAKPVAEPAADERPSGRGTLGQQGLLLMLSEVTDETEAAAAARGWGGDRFVTWNNRNHAEVRAALEGLGYAADEIREVLAALTPEGPVEVMLRDALRRYLSEDQLGRYQPWFDNARWLKELVAKLEIASLQALQTAEGPTAKTATSDSAAPRKPRSTHT